MNIREYLNKLDNEALENNTKYYDLRNLYDSSKLDEIDELKLQAMVDSDASADRIFDMLTDGSSNKMLDEGLITVEVPDEDLEVVFAKFEELLNNTYIDFDMVASKAEEMYEPHRGDPVWDAAFKKWNCEDCCCEEEPCEEPITLRNKLSVMDSQDIVDEKDFFDLRNNYDNANLSEEDQEELNKFILDGASEKEIYDYLQTRVKPEEVFNDTEDKAQEFDKNAVLNLFYSLMNNRYLDADAIFTEAEDLYKPHAGEAAWDQAYAEFTGKINHMPDVSSDVEKEDVSIYEFLKELDKNRFLENESYVGMKDLFEAADAAEKAKDADFIRQNANNPEAIAAYFAGKNSTNENLNEEKETLTESTRSAIARLNDDGSVDAIYCHNDGYPEHNGDILRRSYNTKEKVDELLDLGQLSYLDDKIAPNDSDNHSFDHPAKGVTIAYHRDRGEELNPANHFDSKEDFLDNLDDIFGADFAYIFDGNKWHIYDYNGSELTEDLEVNKDKKQILTEEDPEEKELYDIELEWVSDFDDPSIKDIKAEVKQLAFESNAEDVKFVDFIPVEGEIFNKVIIRGTEDDLRNCLITYCAGDDINAEALLDNAVKVTDNTVEVANDEEPIEECANNLKEEALAGFQDEIKEELKELPSEMIFAYDDLCKGCDLKTEQEVADIVMDKLVTDYNKKVTFKLDLQPDFVKVYEIAEDLKESEHDDIQDIEAPYDSLLDKEIDDALNEAKECSSDNVCVGDKIKIVNMEGEPQYEGKEGTVTDIDGIDQIHGTWGGCALIPGVDKYEVIKAATNENLNADDKSFYIAYTDKHGNDAAYILNANSEKEAEDKFKFLDLGELVSVSETTKDEVVDMQNEIDMGFVTLDESIDPGDQLKMELESALNDFLNGEGGKVRVEVSDNGDNIVIEIDGIDAYENAEKVEELDQILMNFDEDAYFDAEDYGIITAFVKVKDINEGLDGDPIEYDNGKKCPDCGKNSLFEIEGSEDVDGKPIYQCQSCGAELVKDGIFGKYKKANYNLKEKFTLEEN